MRKIVALGFVLTTALHTGKVDAQSWPQPCAPVALDATGSNLSNANTAYLKFLESTFPEEFANPYNPNDVTRDLRNLIRSALTEAALKWNRSCGHPPVLNDQPVLVPANSTFEIPAGTKGAFLVEIAFDSGFAEPSVACESPFDQERCHTSLARAFMHAWSSTENPGE